MSENEMLATLTLEQLLGDTKDEVIQSLPQEGIEFGAGSFIAQWTVGILYWFMTEKDYGQGFEVKSPDHRDYRDPWYHMYYRDYNDAMAAYTELEPGKVDKKDRHYSPNPTLGLIAPTSTMKNSPDLAKFQEGFGQEMIYDTKILPLRRGTSKYSQDWRHTWHFLALPGIVAAFAKVLGEDVEYNIDEFLVPGAEALFTDEYFEERFGSLSGDYHDCTYARKRATLWSKLGDDDFTTCAMIGAKTAKGKPDPHSTVSPLLSGVFNIIQGEPRVFWGRVVAMPDPRPEAVSKNGNRLTVYVMTDVYASEAHAIAAAKEDLADRGVEVEDDDAPPLPENWVQGDPKGDRADWVEAVKAFKGPPSKAQEALYATNAEIREWRAYIKENDL